MRTINRSLPALSLVALTCFSVSPVHAAERQDYDLDDDGLIEIEDLQDLNEIRNNYDTVGLFELFQGHTLYGVSTGCPESGCRGYELVADLDFDTNGNGRIDAGDRYWNEGAGWEPIGGFSPKFTAELNGNGHILRNLFMVRPREKFGALIGYAEEAYIHDLKLQADMTIGRESGALLGYIWKTRVENIAAQVTVTASGEEGPCDQVDDCRSVGGLIGIVDEGSVVSGVFMQADVSGDTWIGGVAGELAEATMTDVVARMSIQGETRLGAVVGNSRDSQYQRIMAEVNGTGVDLVGGAVGRSSNDTFEDLLVTGELKVNRKYPGYQEAGGLLGYATEGSLSRAISLVKLQKDEENEFSLGAVVGYCSVDQKYAAIYWARDLAGRTEGCGYKSTYEEPAQQHFDLVDIQCATSATNRCNGLSYEGFDQINNAEGKTLWQFGSNTEAPGMLLLGRTWADRDGDGHIDDWPTWPSEGEQPGAEKPGTDNPGNSSGGGSAGLGVLALGLVMLLRRRQG
ncbi:hypothetical protein [Gynuella sunshinyii]|uniref:Uncharacterized protein n=1 Tax=Gynuella sunshinyii YC6258 TaxID=1445510 RepID=A0A0C5VSI7_9GAMM|nr:hypothetical protein [Gynuella sunshinyii]AJQ97652.1 hypothetical Protein YC6258_05624 [Gynuella sunshinyii YC6258]